MKRFLLLSLILVGQFSVLRASDLEVIKLSQFPLTQSLASNQIFLIATPGMNNRAIQAGFFLDAVWPYSLNAATVNNQLTILNNSVAFKGSSNNVAVEDGVTMTPVTQGATNLYWIDFGLTNHSGQKLIYGTLTATNDIKFLGTTNVSQWSLFSLNVIASAADRRVYVPTNGWRYFKTNSWLLQGTNYMLVLTNGNLFRLSIQSNQVMEYKWDTLGQ